MPLFCSFCGPMMVDVLFIRHGLQIRANERGGGFAPPFLVAYKKNKNYNFPYIVEQLFYICIEDNKI